MKVLRRENHPLRLLITKGTRIVLIVHHHALRDILTQLKVDQSQIFVGCAWLSIPVVLYTILLLVVGNACCSVACAEGVRGLFARFLVNRLVYRAFLLPDDGLRLVVITG